MSDSMDVQRQLTVASQGSGPGEGEINQLMALFSACRHGEAEELARNIVETWPSHGFGWKVLGAVLFAEGRLAEALSVLEKALVSSPSDREMHYNLGNVLRVLGRLTEAEARYRRALELDPDFHLAHNNLGNTLKDLGRLTEAEASYRRALELDPEYCEAMLNMARVLDLGNRHGEAVEYLRRAVALRPQSAAIHHVLGAAYILSNYEEEAVEELRTAISLDPTAANAHNDLGNALKNMGLVHESIVAYREAVRLSPAHHAIRSNLAIACLMDDRASEQEVYAEHRRFGEAVEASLRQPPRSAHPNDRDPERRLRIAYLGPYFSKHILMQSVLPVIRAHDRERFEVQVFAHVPIADDVTRQVQASADEFSFIHEMDDDAAADAVSAAGIDVLIHPMGHWAYNRLPVLARKPAPVQISYLCNCPTTGLAAVDAVIVDPWLNPEDRMRRLAVEAPVSLAHGFAVYCEPAVAPIKPEPPLHRFGRVTFGSFNNPAKLTDRALLLWSRVLDAVPDARLLVKYTSLRSTRVMERLFSRLAACGIDGKRVVMLGPTLEHAAHLATYNEVDIVLDTVPFTGGRTTIDALWMGVPVVSRLSEPMWSRISYSYLCRIGLGELAVADDDAYVALAVALAHDPDRLANWRTTLRARVRASSLMDAPAHTREFEAAICTLWRKWCDQQ